MKNIKFFNIRDGFANNSSSTHSIIFTDTPNDIKDDYNISHFGWDFFTVASKTGVLEYLGASLYQNLHLDISHDYITAIVDTWTTPLDYSNDISVDHQSLLTFPYTYDRKGINKQYFDEIKELLLSNNTLILGGNDNTEQCHPLFHEGDSPTFISIEKSNTIIAKKDNVYNYWTLFNYYNGSKTRLVIDNTGERIIMPTKGSSPDIIDIKLTDFCSFNCQFCYQGSTTNGKHADIQHLRPLIWELSEHEVLEIAYGGGEPTSHPDFIEILNNTKDQHIVPNFTTKNIKWLKNNINDIKDIIGSCAVSIQHYSEIKPLANIINFYELPNHKICIQIVMGTISEYQFELIVNECSKYNIPLTLLGFKQLERGITFKCTPYPNWFNQLTKLKQENKLHCNIGVDTALVQQSLDIFKDNDLPQWLYHKDEGVFSWYIDAVNKKMGPSSYHETNPYKYPTDFIKQYTQYGDNQCL